MLIKGYKYLNEQDAIDAREQCDIYYGIPISPDDVTKNWVEYQFAELNIPTFWYIRYNESLVIILGEPTEFDLINYPPQS